MKPNYPDLLLKNKIIISLSLFLFLFLLITLSGCTNFHEKLQPDQMKWALTQGDKTIIIRGYIIDKHKHVYQCGKRSFDAVLMPDTPYFREVIHVARTNYTFGHKKPLKESVAFIRHAQKQKTCEFTFNNVPSGKWIAIIDLWYYLKSNSNQAGNMVFTTTYPAPDLTYVPLTIKTEDTTIKKNMIMDFNKRTDLGFFKQRKAINLGEFSDWENPPKLSEKILLHGLNSQ